MAELQRDSYWALIAIVFAVNQLVGVPAGAPPDDARTEADKVPARELPRGELHPDTQRTPPPASPTGEYLITLEAARPTLPTDSTAEEDAIVGAHFVRLQRDALAGRVICVGRTMEDAAPLGIVVFRADSPQAALDYLHGDPAITAGLMSGAVRPFGVALHDGRIEKQRYPRDTVRDRIELSVEVAAPVAEVWTALTTEAGVKTFFAPAAQVELAVGGPYEIYFAPTAAVGERGGEGCRVLSFVPERMLAFSWNAPPSIPETRDRRTQVHIFLEPIDAKSVRVELIHSGFGRGASWEKTRTYFEAAWPYVLGNLQRRFARGPIDWSANSGG